MTKKKKQKQNQSIERDQETQVSSESKRPIKLRPAKCVPLIATIISHLLLFGCAKSQELLIPGELQVQDLHLDQLNEALGNLAEASASFEPALLQAANDGSQMTDRQLFAVAPSPSDNGQLEKVKAGSRDTPEISSLSAHSSNLHKSEAKHPPVYLSAPKQISALNEISNPASKKSSSSSSASAIASETPQRRTSSGPLDLRTSPSKGNRHKKKKKKKRKKMIIVKKKKKKKKTKKKKKKKRRISHVVVKKLKVSAGGHAKMQKIKKITRKKPQSTNYYGALGSGSSPAKSKYFEERAVPNKGSYKFAFKRGNSKHNIERKEMADKTKVRSEFKWVDPKGKGKLVFDLSHIDKKKKNWKAKHHAAASEPRPHKLDNQTLKTTSIQSNSIVQTSADQKKPHQ